MNVLEKANAIKNIKEKSLFFREVEIMYKLDHPNIAKLYSHFEDNNFYKSSFSTQKLLGLCSGLQNKNY